VLPAVIESIPQERARYRALEDLNEADEDAGLRSLKGDNIIYIEAQDKR